MTNYLNLYMKDDMNISELIGKTLKEINQDIDGEDNDTLKFITVDDEEYLMFHYQNCCENVFIEDICGDLDDLINTPILEAYESYECWSEDEGEENYKGVKDEDGYFSAYGDYQWTFYILRTIKGSVTIRWYGTSNGYYSISVAFRKLGNEH